MNEKIQIIIALIGVWGTLAGTILGWLLNNLSKRGKLNVYVTSFVDSFKYNNLGVLTPSSSIEQTQHYSYEATIDLYNSSNETKILRNLTVIFSDGNNDLHKSIPNDNRTERYSSHRYIYDKISPINVPPKTIIQIKLSDGESSKDNGLDFIWKTKKVYLTYTNERGKKKKVNIKSELYKNYFENHKTEDIDNG